MTELFVNKEACIGCGMCVSIDPTHFDFDEDGLSSVTTQENIESEDVQNAISSCPTSAIGYAEKEEGCQNPKCHCENCTCDDCHCDEGECHCEGCQEQ